MSRFQFIADEYPEIFELCSDAEKNKRENVDLLMLKVRQAFEKIISLADPYSLDDNLFDQINSLSGKCSLFEMESMHTLRRLSNMAIHGKNISEKDIDEALKALLLSCCWLYFKIGEKSCPLSMFLKEDRNLVAPYVNLSLKNLDNTEGKKKNNHSINPLAFDSTFGEIEDNEQSILDKDVFETEEEYEERIWKLPPVHLGFGMIDVKQMDSYTHLAFPRFSLLKNEKIIGADIKAFVGKIEQATDEDYDGEILVALKVYRGQIYYDYSHVSLKSDDRELPLIALYWKPFAYETQSDFKERLERLPVLPVGVCKPIKQRYDLEKQILPFQVSGFSFVQEVFSYNELNIFADRHMAKQICQGMGLWRVYGKVESEGNDCFLDAEIISNGVMQNPVNKDDRFQITNSNINEKKFAKEQNELGKEIRTSGNYDEVVNGIRKAADQGDAAAQVALGACYYFGEGVEQDYRESVTWYRKAADQGDATAQLNLGHCYEKGEGVEQDYQEAVTWYRKAADQGDAAVQCALGVCYYTGEGVEQDYQEAVTWYRKAAEQGYADAQYALGGCYCAGKGVEQDYQEAVTWIQKAADQGQADAQYALGNCYYAGKGVEQDYQEAVTWYRKAAEQGYADAQYALGDRYYVGIGVERDFREAVKWYMEAAGQGQADAQYQLGDCYYFGIGVEEDRQEAVTWYRKAADQGHAAAQYSLGSCYEEGEGVEQDDWEAVKWYQKAADQGNEDAKEALKNLE